MITNNATVDDGIRQSDAPIERNLSFVPQSSYRKSTFFFYQIRMSINTLIFFFFKFNALN